MNYFNYFYPLVILVGSSILYEKYKKMNKNNDDIEQYELVKKYLLNDSSLAKSKKPIIWIHMVYDINSRWWPSFSSRNTDCLNQPYLYLTIKSIIDKCGEDFNICLIDDDTFSNIIPGWATNLNMVADPLRSKIRQLALAKLLHIYGGFLVPNSFLCFESLLQTYNDYTMNNKMFVAEMVDRNSTSQQVNYFPNTKMMGCQKECSMMNEYINYLETLVSNDYTDESNFVGSYNRWCNEKIMNGKMNIIPAKQLGIKDINNAPVTIERLIGNTYIEMNNSIKGLYIPADEILKRTSFQWFARLSAKQALSSDTIIGKYLLIAR